VSIQELIDKALVRNGERIRSGKYSPSSLGRCYRNQYWNRKNEPVSNPIDERTLRVFKAGDLFHEFVQSLVVKNNPSAQIEVRIEDDDFLGYADIVLNDEVDDIKSQHSRAFWYRSKLQWKDLEDKLYCNILQVLWYAVKLGKVKARLVFVSKDDLCIQEYPIILNDRWIKKLNEEINTLQEWWRKQELPPALPRAYLDDEGKSEECKYCQFLDTCKALEKNKCADAGVVAVK